MSRGGTELGQAEEGEKSWERWCRLTKVNAPSGICFRCSTLNLFSSQRGVARSVLQLRRARSVDRGQLLAGLEPPCVPTSLHACTTPTSFAHRGLSRFMVLSEVKNHIKVRCPERSAG